MAVNLDDLFRGVGQRMTQAIPAWQSLLGSPSPQAGNAWNQIAQPQPGGNAWNQIAPAQSGGGDPWGQLVASRSGGGDPWGMLGVSSAGGGDPWNMVGAGAGQRADPWQALSLVNQARNKVTPTPNSGAFVATGTGALNPDQQQWWDKSKSVASAHGIDGDIFAQLMHHESAGFDPNVIHGARNSPAGAKGIAQFMDPTAAQYHVNPLDPDQALDGAARYFSDLLHQYGGDYQKAVIAYNGGDRAVKAWDSGQPFAESRAEVAAVLRSGQTPTAPTAGGGNYVFPVEGYNSPVSLHWGAVKGGSDLFAPRGTNVFAMRGGQVLESGVDHVGGNSVLIQGDDGNQYYYAHLDAPSPVRAGQRVDAGTYLGPVGDTGDAKGTGTHLHIGIGPTIKLGADKYGGTGGDYDAVGLLQSVLNGGR